MGLSSVQTDPSFYQFDSPTYGIRAIAIVLSNYEKFYNLRTVEEIIGRWAPAHENPTETYVNFVSREIGHKPNTILDLQDPLTVQDLCKAIIKFENGEQPYSDLVVAKAVRAAGIT